MEEKLIKQKRESQNAKKKESMNEPVWEYDA